MTAAAERRVSEPPEYPHGRFQFCRYPLGPRSVFRLWVQRYGKGDSLAPIYRWRIAVGPFDLRRWRPWSEGKGFCDVQ